MTAQPAVSSGDRGDSSRASSRFYDTTRPDGPRPTYWYAARHGFLKPGDHVTYVAHPAVATAGLSGEHEISELIMLGATAERTVTAILDGGLWEVQADNLRRVDGRHRRNGNGSNGTDPG